MRISDWSSDVCSSDLRRWAPWLAFLLIIACWEAASDTGLLPALFMPAPHEVLSALYMLLASGQLFVHIAASLERIVSGWIIGSIAGLAFGLCMGIFVLARSVGLPEIGRAHV